MRKRYRRHEMHPRLHKHDLYFESCKGSKITVFARIKLKCPIGDWGYRIIGPRTPESTRIVLRTGWKTKELAANAARYSVKGEI